MKTLLRAAFLAILPFSLFAETFVYFHGGPGFNSKPEETLLRPTFEENGHTLHLWHEPSQLRPNGDSFDPKQAFASSLESALQYLSSVGPAVVIGHSFGSEHARYVALARPDLVKKLVLVGPSPNIHASDLNIMLNGLKLTTEQKKFDRLSELMATVQPGFDAQKLEAFTLATANPAIFLTYFSSPAMTQKYFGLMTGEFAVDMASFVQTRVTQYSVLPGQQVQSPTQVIFGTDDRVVNASQQLPTLRKQYAKFSLSFLKGGHYPHLESPAQFLELIESL